jgi:hypothetical protein
MFFGTSRAEKWPGRCVGLDLGATRDLSTLVVVWENGDGVFHEKPYCWLPGDVKSAAS